MSDRPYVLLSCAMSIDGCIDDTTPQRLRLSNAADFDRVDAERARCDAILVGAGTIRADDPKLLIRSASRRDERVARGLPADLVKVTMSSGGDLDPESRFFTTGDAAKLVYTTGPAVAVLRDRLAGRAEVVDTAAITPDAGTTTAAAADPGSPHEGVRLPLLLADLARRGVRRLMVEGGGGVHTRFLTEDLVDELQLAVAPFFIGDPDAPRFVHAGAFPQSPSRPLRLAEATAMGPAGDVVLLRYLVDAPPRTDRTGPARADTDTDVDAGGR